MYAVAQQTQGSSLRSRNNLGLVTREWSNRRATEQATRAAKARQASGRRRFVDPTTCERDYSQAEIEFMLAMNEYKQKSGRMFPTWSEVLEVLRSLGYEKFPDARDAPSKPSRATWRRPRLRATFTTSFPGRSGIRPSRRRRPCDRRSPIRTWTSWRFARSGPDVPANR